MPRLGNWPACPPCTRVPALWKGSNAESLLAIFGWEGLAPPAEVSIFELCGWTKAYPYAISMISTPLIAS